MVNPEFAWQTILIISALCALCISLKQLIEKPVGNLRDAIYESTTETKLLRAELKNMNKSIADNEIRNAEEHRKLWGVADKHGLSLEEHETRITVIENDHTNKER